VISLSAQGRFSVIVVAALAALLAVAMIMPCSRFVEAANRGTGDVESIVYRSEPVVRVQPLERVWLTDLGSRFPEMRNVAASRMSPLTTQQIVSYYGNPHTASMGILGSDDPENVASLLQQHASRYDALNGARGVMPAIHLVYAVAQPHATSDGLYLQHLDDELVEQYIRIAEERDMLLFLDLQIGRSSVREEVGRVERFLRHDNVHLAIDPEFAMQDADVPGAAIGSVTADDINAAQAALQEIVVTERLPSKMLMVHQFLDGMVVDGNDIQHRPGVDLIIDADGYGPSTVKRATYERYASRAYASHAAIKLFFDWDTDLMSEHDVLALDPPPAVVVYQ